MPERDQDELLRAATELLVRYANAIDLRDWVLLRTCFTDDCDADYGELGHWQGSDEVAQWMDQTHAPLGPTLHRITNVSVAGGEVPRARAYIHGVVTTADRTSTIHAYGHYDDELVDTPEGWRIARRRYTTLTTEVHSSVG